MGESRKIGKKAFVGIGLGGVLLVLLPTLLDVLGWVSTTGSAFHFLESAADALGVAFIVSSILGFTSDRYLHEYTAEQLSAQAGEIIRGVAERVGPAYIAQGMPPEVAGAVLEIKTLQVFRRNVTLTLNFEPDGESRLRIKKTVSYSVANFSKKAHEHIHRANSTASQVTLVRAAGKDLGTGDRYVLGEGDIEMPFERPVTIPAKGEKNDNEFESTFLGSDEARDTDVIFLGDPCLGITVRVQKPETLRVRVWFSNLGPTEPTESSPTLQVWRCTDAFLPRGMVGVSWEPHAKRHEERHETEDGAGRRDA